MTPDLLAAFESGMEDLEDVLHVLERHGPGYLRTCLEASRRRCAPPAPRELPPVLAKAIRELADDALVRTGPPSWGAS